MHYYHEKLKEIHSAIKTMSVFIASIKPEQLKTAENVDFIDKADTMAYDLTQIILEIRALAEDFDFADKVETMVYNFDRYLRRMRTPTDNDEIIAATMKVEAFFDSVHDLNDYILNETDFTSEDALKEIKSCLDEVANNKNAALIGCEIIDEKFGG